MATINDQTFVTQSTSANANMNEAKIRSLKKQLSIMREKRKKQDNRVQRLVETEKRNHQHKRYDGSRRSTSDQHYAEGLSSFFNNVGTTAEDCATSVGPTLGMIQDTLKSLMDSMAEIRKIFRIPTNVDLYSLLLSLYSLNQCFVSRSIFGASLHLINIAMKLNVSYEDILSLIPDFSTPTNVANAESLSSIMTNATFLFPVTGFLTLVFGIFNILCSGTVPNPASVSKHFANVGRAASGFRSIRDLISFVYDYFCEIYYTTVYGMTTEQYQLTKEYPQLEEIFAACKLIEDLTKPQIDSAARIANQVLAVRKTINDMLVTAARANATGMKHLLNSFNSLIKTQVGFAEHSPARAHSIRAEPVSIYLYGRPGTGKSVMTEVLVSRIFKQYLKQDGILYKSSSFVRKAVNEFWEGYTHQPIVLLDDFANAIDSIQKPNLEYDELVNMVNNVPYPLHMATMSEKASTYFDSKFIIASSNQRTPKVVSKVDAGAIFRRFHMYAEVKISSDYGKLVGSGTDKYYQFDADKARAFVEKSNRIWDPLCIEHYRIDVYVFDVKTPTNVTVVKENLTFEEFWNEYKDLIESRSSTAKDLQQAIRREAGISEEMPHDTESEVMAKFDIVFNREEFIDALVEDENAGVFADAPETPWTLFDMCKDTRTALRNKFNKHVEEAREKLTAFVAVMANGVDTTKSSLVSVASFILSFVKNLTSKTYNYFPSVPTPSILIGMGAAFVALLGVWYTGMFRAGSSSWCEFAHSPSCASAPCKACQWCDVFNFPKTGNMASHFIDRVQVPQIRKEIVETIGQSTESLFENTFRLIREQSNHEACAEKLYESQPIKPRHVNYAEKTYENQPLKSKHVNYAEGKLYDSQPLKSKHVSYAESGRVIKARTEINIGCTTYAERDQVQVEQSTQVLLNNAVWIQAVDADGMASRSNGVFLTGRTMLTTAHTVIDGINKYVTIMIYNPYNDTPTVSVPYQDCHISQMHQIDGRIMDLALITFPCIVPSRPRILSKFIDNDNLSFLNEGSLIFSGFRQVRGKTIVEEKHPSDFSVSKRVVSYLLHKDGTCPSGVERCTCPPVEIGHHIEYDLATGRGLCGSLLSVSNKLVHTKLVGFHVAGGVGVVAYGVLTSRQLLERNLNDHVTLFNIPKSYLIDGRLPYSQSYVSPHLIPSLIQRGDCLAIGAAIPVVSPVKTQLSPSLVFDSVQKHITKPAHLRAVETSEGRIDPMEKGLLKVMKPQTYIDQNLLEVAINDVFDVIGVGNPRVLTYEESIKGVEGDAYMRPVNRTTSPGYPYNLNNPSKGKTKWLGSGEDYDVSNIELRKDVDDLISDAANYVRGNAISIATLKDEKRPIAKVDEIKTRVFEACPQHLVLALRQYYLSFVAHVMKGRIDNEICVGINPYSLEWTKLATHLESKGDNIVAGDFSNFDGSLSLQIVGRIAEKINEWYDDDAESQAIRITLWEHICNADVLVKDEVIRQTHSQPSGNPLTVIVNSIFNSVIMRLAYLSLKKEQGLSPFCDFTTHVANANYGDDNVLSISSSIIKWFNQVSITRILATFGMVYTDELKSGVVVPLRSLTEIAFLKRKFVMREYGRYDAPMDLANILEMTNWIRGKAKKAATLENCDAALMELSYHDPEIYDIWSKKIQKECSNVNLNLRRPTYYEWYELHAGERDNYARELYIPIW